MDQTSEVFDKMMQLGLALGVSSIKDLPGAWVQKVDERWTFAVNGHEEDIRVDRPELGMAATVMPFNAAVWYNGWLCASLSPFDGVFFSGSAANEDTFIEALDKAIHESPKV